MNVVVMFQKQFVTAVANGSKPHTIRPIRKGRSLDSHANQIKAGDTLSLRHWAGKAYRSKHVLIKNVVCTRASDIEITENKIVARGIKLGPVERETLAVADGFKNYDAMMQWFKSTHGLPFTGRLIEWESV